MNQATTSREMQGLTNEELLMLKDFLSKSSGMNFSFHMSNYKNDWIIDTGASQHMSGNLHHFDKTPIGNYEHYVTIPSGEICKVNSIGDITLSQNIVLKNVFYIPEFKVNLISVNKLTSDSNLNVIFDQNECHFQEKISGRVIGQGKSQRGLYFWKPSSPEIAYTAMDFEVWHKRLGHLSSGKMKILVKNNKIECKSINSKSIHDCNNIGKHDVFFHENKQNNSEINKNLDFIKEKCHVCPLAKQAKLKYKNSLTKSKHLFELIHIDVWGKFPINSHDGYSFFLTIVEDLSRTTWIFLIKTKNMVLECIKNFIIKVKNFFDKNIKTIRSDNGGEFSSNNFKILLEKYGIEHQYSCPYSPQQNAIVERKHKHLLEVARALHFQSEVPLEYWGECILTAAHIINRIPSRVLENKTPYEILHKKTPDYNNFKTFGCLCYATTNIREHKFSPRTFKGIFMGYPPNTKGYLILEIENMKFHISRNVVFRENIFPFKDMPKNSQNKEINKKPLQNLYEQIIHQHNENNKIKMQSGNTELNNSKPQNNIPQTDMLSNYKTSIIRKNLKPVISGTNTTGEDKSLDSVEDDQPNEDNRLKESWFENELLKSNKFIQTEENRINSGQDSPEHVSENNLENNSKQGRIDLVKNKAPLDKKFQNPDQEMNSGQENRINSGQDSPEHVSENILEDNSEQGRIDLVKNKRPLDKKFQNPGQEGCSGQSILNSQTTNSDSSSENFLEQNQGKTNPENIFLQPTSQRTSLYGRKIIKPKHLQDFVLQNEKKEYESEYPMSNHVSYNKINKHHKHFLKQITVNHEPSSYNEASNDPKWVEAMQNEMRALKENNTWTLTNLPKNRKSIGSKWIYKIKYKPDGQIERYKARLVAKGFTQKEGFDFFETFAPVVKMVTIKSIIAIAAIKRWNLYQLDVNNAFLHGELHEEVYLKPPQGLLEEKDKRVCKLNKSLYGLKQASRSWFEKLRGVLLDIGFHQAKSDYSLFIREKNQNILYLVVYVDDIIITGSNELEIGITKILLEKQFKLKDLGILSYFLGIEVSHSPQGIYLSQRKYALGILEESGLSGAKPSKIPMERHIDLKNDDSLLIKNPTFYRKMVGKMIYLNITRPDLSFTVNWLSQFMHEPKEVHLKVLFKLIRYIKNAPGQGLLYSKNGNMVVKGYCDADWAACQISRKSLTGFCIMLGDSLISWKTKKQNTIARSSCEAEYRAIAQASCEIIWIHQLMGELKIKIIKPTDLYCDNKSAIHLANNPVFHERTKHIEVDCHFIRDMIIQKKILLKQIGTKFQLADFFNQGTW